MGLHLKNVIYILGLLVLVCCKPDAKPRKVSYYPSKEHFDDKSVLTPIDLDTTSLSFWDIFLMTPDIDYRKNVPFFEIENDSNIKRIVPFIPTHVKLTELMTITMDSVITDKRYSLSDLDTVMQNTFGNQEVSAFYDYRESQHAVRVLIDIDTSSSGKELKKILLKTTDAFDKVKNTASDSLYLYIYFSALRSLY